MDADGYCDLPADLVAPHYPGYRTLITRLKEAVTKLVSAGWSATFIVVYDEVCAVLWFVRGRALLPLSGLSEACVPQHDCGCVYVMAAQSCAMKCTALTLVR